MTTPQTPPPRPKSERMAIDPKKVKVKSNEYPLLIANCSKCGSPQFLASGYNALGITYKRMLFMLTECGWAIAPRFLCRSCACPMTRDEMLEAQCLFDSIKPRQAGSEFRRFSYDEHHASMIAKYGFTVNRFFSSIEKHTQSPYKYVNPE